MVSTEGKIKSKNVFYASIKLLVKAFFKIKFLNKSAVFFLFIWHWYLKSYINKVYENIVLIYVNTLAFVG